MNAVLTLKNIELKRGDFFQLKNINLTINQGEKIALLGESGSGKSTLISIANGSLFPSQGEVRWKGMELKCLHRKHRIDIATLWQDLRLVEELNVGQNINVGALGNHGLLWAIRNLITTIDTKSCLSCLKAVSLPKSIISSKISQLSGGQRQRVAIARLLRQPSQLILADEPLSNLDPTLAKAMLKLLIESRTSDSINIPDTCLISLHRPDLIFHFTRIIGLKKGKLVIDVPAKKLTTSSVEMLYKNT